MKGDFGRKLKKLREAAGMTQEKLAERIGVGFGQIGRYERGKQCPSEATLKRLCEVLKVKAKDLALGVRHGD